MLIALGVFNDFLIFLLLSLWKVDKIVSLVLFQLLSFTAESFSKDYKLI